VTASQRETDRSVRGQRAIARLFPTFKDKAKCGC
jgi:hypothetical protein